MCIRDRNDTSNGEIIFDGKKINGHLSHSEKNDLIPVSYTHLDVYKRQILSSGL